MKSQLAFVEIFEQSERELWRTMNAYARKYAVRYREFGACMTQGATINEYEIRRRFAFAILSANAPWQESVNALRYAEKYEFDIIDVREFAQFKMVPAKADYLRALPQGDAIRALLHTTGETWIDYRERLVRTVKGLGRCKASFAALLLYATESPLACIDTWIIKVYLGESSFKSLSRASYEAIEKRIQRFGARHELNGALAQWCIWNAVRKDPIDSAYANHDIFLSVGSHKGVEVVPF